MITAQDLFALLLINEGLEEFIQPSGFLTSAEKLRDKKLIGFHPAPIGPDQEYILTKEGENVISELVAYYNEVLT